MRTAFSCINAALCMQDSTGVACAFVKPRHPIVPESACIPNLPLCALHALRELCRPAVCIPNGPLWPYRQTTSHGCRWSWLWAFGMGDMSSELPLARNKSYAEDQRLTDDSELSGADCRTLSKRMSTLVPPQSFGLAGLSISGPMSDRAAACNDVPEFATMACGFANVAGSRRDMHACVPLSLMLQTKSHWQQLVVLLVIRA